MKVLSVQFGDFGTPHLETDADLIQQHLDKGDQVVQLVCDAALPVCLYNPGHDLAVCTRCICRRESITRYLQPRVEQRPLLRLTPEDRRLIAAFPCDASDLASLKEMMFRSFDVGIAVAATLVDLLVNPDPDLTQIPDTVRNWIGVSLAVYLSTINWLDELRPDRVYVMNGRWSHYRAVLRACQERGVDCCCHERGGDLSRYMLFVNRLPHDIAPLEADIRSAWQQAPPGEREVIGARYYEEKASGFERQWFSFVSGQQKGLLPEDWDRYPAGQRVAVFASSEFEFAAIGPEWAYPFYEDQTDGLRRLVASLEERGSPLHLFIRTHPNMKGVKNAKMDWLLSLRSPNATVLPPESPVSSYALLRCADKVLTFGSTMGIEASFWNKPSIMAGRCFYQNLGATYNPGSHEELLELLHADLQPRPRDAAVMYGYFLLSMGQPHQYYEPHDPFNGRFKGHAAWEQVPLAGRVVRKLAHLRPLQPLVRLLGRWHQKRQLRQMGMLPAVNGANHPLVRSEAKAEKHTECSVLSTQSPDS